MPSQDFTTSAGSADEKKSLDRRKSAADIDKELEELLSSESFGGNMSIDVSICQSGRSSLVSASSLDAASEELPRLLDHLVNDPASASIGYAIVVKEEHNSLKPVKESQISQQTEQDGIAGNVEQGAEENEGEGKTYTQRMSGAVDRIAQGLAHVRRLSNSLVMTGDLRHDVASVHI